MTRRLQEQFSMSRQQSSIVAKYSITNHDANRRNLARWYEKMRNGAWERENFEENFGTSERA